MDKINVFQLNFRQQLTGDLQESQGQRLYFGKQYSSWLGWLRPSDDGARVTDIAILCDEKNEQATHPAGQRHEQYPTRDTDTFGIGSSQHRQIDRAF